MHNCQRGTALSAALTELVRAPELESSMNLLLNGLQCRAAEPLVARDEPLAEEENGGVWPRKVLLEGKLLAGALPPTVANGTTLTVTYGLDGGSVRSYTWPRAKWTSWRRATSQPEAAIRAVEQSVAIIFGSPMV